MLGHHIPESLDSGHVHLSLLLVNPKAAGGDPDAQGQDLEESGHLMQEQLAHTHNMLERIAWPTLP
jgi:hypothetical protein